MFHYGIKLQAGHPLLVLTVFGQMRRQKQGTYDMNGLSTSRNCILYQKFKKLR